MHQKAESMLGNVFFSLLYFQCSRTVLYRVLSLMKRLLVEGTVLPYTAASVPHPGAGLLVLFCVQCTGIL